ncbi:MAG: NAD(P)H-hydrate epimerase [Planctomycetia bacterium]|nr:NAD(P)H-hydrate epimerase [Planctomycetia bacterium]
MLLTREQVRGIDRRASDDFGMPGVVLMENAGRGAAEVLLSLGVPGPVSICCGKGNNGGDGFVMARHLANRGAAVDLRLFARPEDLTGDAAMHFRSVDRAGLPLTVHGTVKETELRDELSRSAWIVDALFGTGLTGPVRSPFDQVIAAINASGVRVFAVDLPSGLDCDTGQPLGATVRASHTATFVAPKQGFAAANAREWTGLVHTVDIGVPAVLLAATVADTRATS